MRLLANRLLGEPGLQSPIEAFAKEQLWRIAEPVLPSTVAADAPALGPGGREASSRGEGCVPHVVLR